MKPIFHTFKTHDRLVTLCAVLQDYPSFCLSPLRVGWSVLHPNDEDKNITIKGQSVNYGRLVAQGRAEKESERSLLVAYLYLEMIHPKVIEAHLVNFEHYMTKHFSEFVAAVK